MQEQQVAQRVRLSEKKEQKKRAIETVTNAISIGRNDNFIIFARCHVNCQPLYIV